MVSTPYGRVVVTPVKNQPFQKEGTIPNDTFEKATCRNVDEATDARRIRFENGIMIKTSEGNGGKGIRFVDNEDDLQNAYIQEQNEVLRSPIFIIQLCKNVLHVEVPDCR